jgi:uncharacterized protein (TIGR00290 family)
MKRALLSWSSGKDSAWCLHLLRQQGEYEVLGLLTTFNRAANRVAMHGVRRALVEAQAEAAGISLWDIDLPWPCSTSDYESAMKKACVQALACGIEYLAFGDLFLTDIRRYREQQLRGSGLQPLFPAWGLPTGELASDMIASGLRAKLACVDSNQLSPDFVGREFDSDLLSELPRTVDPCGENGEFHSFVYAGPMFRKDLAIETGVIIRRDNFVFVDLLPRELDGSTNNSHR